MKARFSVREAGIRLSLTSAQPEYLSTSLRGMSRMEMFTRLCMRAVVKDRPDGMFGCDMSVPAVPDGRVEMSPRGLSRMWKCDRKTAVRVLRDMNAFGLVSTGSNHATSVHTILVVGAWVLDGVEYGNPNCWDPCESPSLPGGEPSPAGSGISRVPQSLTRGRGRREPESLHGVFVNSCNSQK